MFDPGNRSRFLNFAGVFEGALAVGAVILAWFFNVDLSHELRPEFLAIGAGFVGAVPPLVVLTLAEKLKYPPLMRIQELVLELMGPSLAACRGYDLVLLAALAGFSEELLFRGVTQPVFERSLGWAAALILSNVIFGLLHFITPTYALAAGFIGAYLGLLLDATGSRNLLVPVVAHAAYDYVAFRMVITAFQKRAASRGGDSGKTADPGDSSHSVGPGP